jgi:hypothetical protein
VRGQTKDKAASAMKSRETRKMDLKNVEIFREGKWTDSAGNSRD